MRRAQAYEACERYKSAIQDVRHVLAYGQEKVGKQSYDLANGMQHRLNRVIAQLKNWVEWLSVRLLLPHITTTPSRFTWKALVVRTCTYTYLAQPVMIKWCLTDYILNFCISIQFIVLVLFSRCPAKWYCLILMSVLPSSPNKKLNWKLFRSKFFFLYSITLWYIEFTPGLFFEKIDFFFNFSKEFSTLQVLKN